LVASSLLDRDPYTFDVPNAEATYMLDWDEDRSVPSAEDEGSEATYTKDSDEDHPFPKFSEKETNASKLLLACACRLFIGRLVFSPSDLTRSISRCIAGVRHYPWQRYRPRRGRCSGPRLLVRRWWIYRYSPTSKMGCGGSGTTGTSPPPSPPPVDGPQQHVSRFLQRVYQLTKPR
jgi:hypothetical protein